MSDNTYLVWVEIEEIDEDGNPTENGKDFSPLIEGASVGSFEDLDSAVRYANTLQALGEAACVGDTAVLVPKSALADLRWAMEQAFKHSLGLCDDPLCILPKGAPYMEGIRRTYRQLTDGQRLVFGADQ